MKPIKKLADSKKIISLTDARDRAVFVGDTHGDLEASRTIWKHYGAAVSRGETYLVFLGDYVDRGKHSKKNVDYLLSRKNHSPGGVFLLLGNHDAYDLRKVNPTNFWNRLNEEEYEHYSQLKFLPWAVQSDGLFASHGALPFHSDPDEINRTDSPFDLNNSFDLPTWHSVVWGDLNERVDGMEKDWLTGRPQFGRTSLENQMDKNGWNLFVRAHQPEVQGWLFDRKVLTIFSSKAYVRRNRAQERNVAEVDLAGGVKGPEDVEVKQISEL